MKVIHIITGLDQGGAESMLVKVVHAAAASDPGNPHEIIALGPIGSIGRNLQAKGFTVQALDMRISIRGFASVIKLAGLLRKAGPQVVVQTWMYHADLIGGVAAWLAGQRRLVWNIRQTGLTANDLSWLTRKFVRACALLSRRLPRYIVSNSHLAIDVHSKVGYQRSKFQYIPNGFDTTFFKRMPEAGRLLRREWGIADEEIVVGLVARLDPQKDHLNFVSAASLVAAKMPRVRFLLVGRGIPGSQALRGALASSGIEELFVLREQREDVPQVMNALDVFCLSSRGEGFPNVLGEAMACEIPSVTTGCGEARALIGNDDLVAPIRDPAALAERILSVAQLDSKQRRSLGRAQRMRIEAQYGIDNVWAQYRDLYTQLLQAEQP